MVDIQSKEVIDKISDELKIQPALQIPREIGKNIQLVYNVESRRNSQIVAQNSASGAAATILATDPERDFFITSANLGVMKDASATSLLSQIRVVINGLNVHILSIPGITLTAQSDNTSVVFFNPVLVDRGSSISVVNEAAVAVIHASGGITGYYTDPQ